MKKNSARGFTLIEILVVIFIMSIVTSVAVLTISRNENRQLESFAKEIQQKIRLMEEEAMLKPSVLGLAIRDNAFQFSTYQKSSWLLTENERRVDDSIPHNIELSLEISGKKIPLQSDNNEKHFPHIVISTNGDITPFTIYVARKGKSPRYIVKGDANGNITSQLLS